MGCPYSTIEVKPKAATATLRYAGLNREVCVGEQGKTVLQISTENKIPHLHECGGNGQCTTCRIRVIRGQENLSPQTIHEKKLSHSRRWASDVRLGCQTRVYGDAEIERLIWSNAEVQKLQLETFPEDMAEERSLAIMFCDLRDFTRISTEQFPFDMAYMLNRFYTMMGDPILMNNGIIYQYVGDEIVGIFGTTGGSQEKACLDAVRAAFGMQAALEKLNREELEPLGTSFKVGIGVHFGKAFVGHLGHPNFRQFSVIGDPVNAASRIQAYTRQSETTFLISDVVASCLPPATLRYGNRFKPDLKGIGEKFELLEVSGFSEMDMVFELQSSLNILLEDEDGFAERFYANLFQKEDSLRDLFKGDMKGQGRLMTHMLSGIVYGLSRPHFLQTGLEALGRNHVRYGVRPEHYPVAHEVFMETICQVLGNHKTENLEHAWNSALDLVIQGMQRGANWN